MLEDRHRAFKLEECGWLTGGAYSALLCVCLAACPTQGHHRIASLVGAGLLPAPAFSDTAGIDRSSAGCEAPDAPLRRVRYVSVDAGPQLQAKAKLAAVAAGPSFFTSCEAFNAVVYPAPSHGLQPVLGVDVLSFKPGAQWMCGKRQGIGKRGEDCL